MKGKQVIISFFLVLFIFLYLYTPPLFSFNILHILSIISYFVILKRYRKEFITFLNTKQVRLFLLFYFFAILSLFCTILFTTKDFIKLYGYVIIPFEVLPTAFYICCVFFYKKEKKDSLFNLIIMASLIQSFLAIITFLNDDFKNLLFTNFYKDLVDSYILTGRKSILGFRMYGFSVGFLLQMPVVQGLIASLCFYFAINKSFKYIIPIPFLLFSAIINARTSFIIFLINLFIILIFYFKGLNIKKFVTITLIVIFTIFAVFATLSFLENTDNELYNWFLMGINEVEHFLRGEKIGTFAVLNNMWHIPNKNIFIGNGYDIFGGGYYSSDIGFINILFLGGISFSFFLYSSYVLFLFFSLKKNNLYLCILVISIFLCNIKGNVFIQSPITNFLFLFVISNYFEDKRLSFHSHTVVAE